MFSKPSQRDLVGRYDKNASNWQQFLQEKHYISAYEQVIDSALPSFPLEPKQTLSVLDAGAGSAGFSLALCNVIHNHRIDQKLRFELLDPSRKMLSEAHNTMSTQPFSFTLTEGDIRSLSLSSHHYDLILCGHVLEHCVEPLTMLRILVSVLNEQGVLVLAVSKPHWCTAMLQILWRHSAFKKNEVINLLHHSGLTQSIAVDFTKGPPKFTSHGYFGSF